MTFPNNEQRRVLESKKRHTSLLAPAGSGKTELLAHRAVKESRRVKAKRRRYSATEPRVLVLTHTTNARDRIQQRIREIEPDKRVWRTIQVWTFHGFALKAINEYGSSRYTVLNDCDERILRQIVAEGVLMPNIPETAMTEILSVVADQKNQNLSVKKIIKRKYPHLKNQQRIIIKTVKELKRRKRKEGIISVDEIPSVFIRLVQSGKLAPSSMDLPPFIIVDEFHDTLFAQWEMIKALARSHTRLFVAGDPDQTIFAWAGASPRRFDDFRTHFPNYAELHLTVNHRSSKQIVALCNHIRSQAKNNSGLKSRAKFTGPKPLVVCGESRIDLSDFAVKSIRKLIKSGVSLEDVAVVYRFHRDRRVLIERLHAKRIPYKVYESRQRRIRPAIGVIFATHRVIEGIAETDPMSTVWKHWKALLVNVEGIGSQSVEKVLSWLRGRKMGCDYTYPGSARAASSLRRLIYTLEKIASGTSNTTPEARLEAIVRLIGNLSKVNKSKMDKELASLFYLASLFESFNDVIERYQDTSYPTCYPAGCQKPSYPDEYLTLSTIHRIKGSGFDTVFYLGTDDFLFERHRCFKGKNRLHEVLLMNVACSRAKRKLILLFPIHNKEWKSGTWIPNPWTIIRNVPAKFYRLKSL